MKYIFILLITLLSICCKTKEKITQVIHQELQGKIIDVNNNEITDVELISKDYNMVLHTDKNGNFRITRLDFIKDFMTGYDLLIALKKEGFVAKKILLNKNTHLLGTNRLKFFTLVKISIPKIIESKTPDKLIVQSSDKQKVANNKDIYTDINVGTVNNKDGNVHIGPVNNDNRTVVNEGDKTTIINETKIIKDTKIVEIPFVERDCAKKEIGYLLIKNSYNEGINIKLTTYGPKKSPMAMRFDAYTVAKKSSKLLRLQSDYHYGLDGEKFSEKWAGTFVYGFNDGFYITPCDTQTIFTP